MRGIAIDDAGVDGVGEDAAEEALPALAADIHQRVVFAESVATGRLARELEPNGTAALEIAAVTTEIVRGIP